VRKLLRSERKRLRYPTWELAKISGISPDYMMKIELNRANPSLEKATNIYKAMREIGLRQDIGIIELFEDDGKGEKKENNWS